MGCDGLFKSLAAGAADVLLENVDRGCSMTPVERELAFGFAGSLSSNVLDLLSSVDKILRSLATSDFKSENQIGIRKYIRGKGR